MADDAAPKPSAGSDRSGADGPPPSRRGRGPLNFSDLTERELLALAISLEEEDERIYDEFATALRESYPDTARMFSAMSAEESGHRHRLIELYRKRFGEHIPLIRRHDVKGFIQRKPIWLTQPLGLEKVRAQAELMEAETKRFYTRAAQRSTDAAVRQLLGDLAAEERRHEATAERLEAKYVTPQVARSEGEAERRLFVLQFIQPGLAGLMDGSVSTLAPLFAAAFATRDSWETFLVGLAAALGAGISMGFAEALSDDGSLTGRGSPWLRGSVCGLMTAVGGLGHALPYLISDFWTATAIAAAVVLVELGVIAWIRNRYMDTPLLAAAFQVVVGGLLVFATGILIGSS
ncbi:iron exporter MbfA [Azospirillum thermophilum]|uniref:Rubrerythrin n=1 Tax=Azospirillum thermophilum TaxID=2202148 RepID=A0A2S2CUU3_9PROT|nr:ferritin family protein [Azospirillum thermophilum]AWK88282.1 rubrerythrin [Azospirillum thermophilum]